MENLNSHLIPASVVRTIFTAVEWTWRDAASYCADKQRNLSGTSVSLLVAMFFSLFNLEWLPGDRPETAAAADRAVQAPREDEAFGFTLSGSVRLQTAVRPLVDASA